MSVRFSKLFLFQRVISRLLSIILIPATNRSRDLIILCTTTNDQDSSIYPVFDSAPHFDLEYSLYCLIESPKEFKIHSIETVSEVSRKTESHDARKTKNVIER